MKQKHTHAQDPEFDTTDPANLNYFSEMFEIAATIEHLDEPYEIEVLGVDCKLLAIYICTCGNLCVTVEDEADAVHDIIIDPEKVGELRNAMEEELSGF